MSRDLEQLWDVCVVGGGPAGSLAARQLALGGRKVVLVDKANFPRPKACGGCLGGVGVDALESVGLPLQRLPVKSLPLEQLDIRCNQVTASLQLLRRRVVSRDELDAALLARAEESGTHVITGNKASLGIVEDSARRVILHDDKHNGFLRAKLVLVAAGLSAVKDVCRGVESLTAGYRPHGRFGLAASLPTADDGYAAHRVTMACGRNGEGYVGLVRLPDGRLDVAAALAPEAMNQTRRSTQPGKTTATGLVERILNDCDLPKPAGFDLANWQAVAALRRKPRRLGADRVLLLGDASGYVEPFTGEGMGWALRQAVDIVPIANQALENWEPKIVDAWARRHWRIVGRRQTRCSWICKFVGGTRWTPHVVRALTIAPWVASPLIRAIDQHS